MFRRRSLLLNKIFTIAAIAVLLILSSSDSFSDDNIASNKLSSFGLTGGASAGLNIYSSDFKQFPDIPNCCTDFTSAIGFGWSLRAGGEYYFKKPLFGMPAKFELTIGVSSLGAKYSQDEFIGHIISGNTYINGTSRYTIDCSIMTFDITPAIVFQPFGNLPLSMKLGIGAGFGLKKSFTQEERIVAPSDATFENGKPFRNDFSGDIPSFSSLLFSLNYSLRYDIWQWHGIKFAPEVGINFALNNVSSVTWKAHSLRAGAQSFISLQSHGIPATCGHHHCHVIPSHQKRKSLKLHSRPLSGGKQLKDGDTIMAQVKRKQELKHYAVEPVIYFKQNSIETVTRNSSFPEADAIGSGQEAIVDYIRNNKAANVNIYVSVTDDENVAELGKKREEMALNMIRQAGGDPTNVKINQVTVETASLKHIELADENRFVRFEFGGNNEVLQKTTSQIVRSDVSMPDLKFKMENRSSAGLSSSQIATGFAGRTICSSNTTDLVCDLNSLKNQVSETRAAQLLDCSAKAQNVELQEAEASLRLYIKSIETIVAENENVISLNDSASSISIYTRLF